MSSTFRVILAVVDAADQRARFVDRAGSRVSIENTASHILALIAEQVADQFALAGHVVVDRPAPLDSWLSLGISQRHFNQERFATAPTFVVAVRCIIAFEADLALIRPVFTVVVELMFVDVHARIEEGKLASLIHPLARRSADAWDSAEKEGIGSRLRSRGNAHLAPHGSYSLLKSGRSEARFAG